MVSSSWDSLQTKHKIFDLQLYRALGRYFVKNMGEKKQQQNNHKLVMNPTTAQQSMVQIHLG